MGSARARRTIGGLLAAATLATTIATTIAVGTASGVGAEAGDGLRAVGAPTPTTGGAVSKAEATDPNAEGGVVTNAVGDVTIDSQGCSPDPVSFGADTTCTYAVQNQTATPANVDLSATGDSELTVTGGTQGATASNGTARAEDVALPPRTGSSMTVAPGPTFAGYYALETIPINPQTIGDEQLLNYTVQPFTWNGTVYTSIGISSNGYAIVGGGDTTKDQSLSPQDLPNATRPNNVLAPFWTDLTPVGGSLRVATVANTAQPPCERSYWFVAQWSMYEYGTTTTRKAQLWIEAKDPECATAVTPAEKVYFTYDFSTMTAAPARPFRIGAEDSTGTKGTMRPAGELPTDNYVVTSTGSVTPAPVVTWNVTGRGTGVGTGTVAATVESDLIPGSSTVFSDVTVTGHPAPVVSDDPDDLTVTTGQQAVFQAAADPGSTVGWEVSTDDGGSWDPVPGATSTTLAFPATIAHDGNRYRAVFSNATGTASTTSAEATLSVEQIDTTTAVTVNPAAPGYGDAVTFTATVSPSTATGSVQFALDGTPFGSPVALSGGTATSPATSALAPGSHTVSASYLGDTDHEASDDSTSFSVGLIPTSTSITNDPVGPTPGDDVTFTATVTPANATGTVEFVIDGEILGDPVPLVNGVAVSEALEDPGLGLHDMWAFYSGDSTHSMSNSGNQNFTVSAKATSFSVLASTPSPQVRLGQAAYTATLSPAPSGGTVQFTVDGQPVGAPVAVVNGTATTPTSAVTAAAGSHTLGASYSGDGTYGAVTDSTSFDVVKAASTITMGSSWNPYFQPQIQEFSLDVGPGEPTGTFQVALSGPDAPSPGTGNVTNGAAWVPITFPSTEHQYEVTITWEGNADLAPTSVTRVFQPETGMGTFVRQAYDVVLDRSADDAGHAYWTGRLGAGAATPIQVVDALARSVEGQRRVVRDAYLDLLGRQPDPAGLAYWQGKLAAGTSPEVLHSSLLASNEGYRRTGGNPLGYSVALYEHLLHRTASSPELTYWTTRLGRFPTTWDRQKAALIIGRSKEGTRSAVRTALGSGCGSTTATDAQKAELADRWLATKRHPTRLAGSALATVCYPDVDAS